MKINVKKGKLFGIMSFVLCLLLFFERLTGGIWHGILGMILVTVLVVHMCRQFRKLKYKKPSVRLVDKMLFVILAVVFLSGMLLHPLQGALAVKILHKLSAVLLVAGAIVHVVQHKEGKEDGKCQNNN